MKKPLLFAILLAGLPFPGRAQIEKIEFCPPSAASLMKVADFPVNTNNGMPEIRIPLHEVSSGNLRLPLVLDFNLDSYIQPNQLPDAPGAGWSLSSDIQIVRSINGEDDFGTWGYCSNRFIPAGYTDTPVDRDRDYLARFHAYRYDEEPDKFYYRLLDKVGVFYFRRNADGSVTPVSVPADGVRIACIRTDGDPSFVITDTDGTVYRFPGTLCEYEQRSDNGATPILSWKCESIRNASQSDSIRFEYMRIDEYSAVGYTPTGIDVYDDYEGSVVRMRPGLAPCTEVDPRQPVLLDFLYGPEHYPGSADSSESYPVGSLHVPPLYLIAQPKYSYDTSYPLNAAGTSRLHVYHCNQNDSFEYVHPQPQRTAWAKSLHLYCPSRIRFRGGSVRFEYDSLGQGVLQRITVENALQQTVKRIVLGQRYAFDHAGTPAEARYRKYDRRLEKLSIDGETYVFDYAQGHPGGVIADFWGYGEGLGYPSYGMYACFVPQHTITLSLGQAAADGGDRPSVPRINIGAPMPLAAAPSNEAFMSIRYPTGGHVAFFTERHRYRDAEGAEHPVGGMRIARIEYYDAEGDAPVRRKIYRYGTNEDGCGVMKQVPDFDETFGNCFTAQRLHYYCKPEWSTSADYEHIGSERKRSYLPYPVFSGDCGVGSWICYAQVAEYDSEDGSLSGKRVYTYDVSGLHDKVQMSEPRAAFPLDAHMWDVGMLDSVVDYEYIASGRFRPVRSVSYTYRAYSEPETIYKGRIWPAELAVPIGAGDASDSAADMAVFHERYSSFVHNYVGMRVGCMQTTSQTERIFGDDGSVRTCRTEYFYDNASCYYRPTRVRFEEWDGDATLRYRLFAPDYADGGMADTLSVMRRANIVDKPVEEFVVRDGAVVAASLYAYDSDGDIVRSYRLKEPGMPVARFRASNQSAAGTFAAPPTAFDPDYSVYEPQAALRYDAAKRPVELREAGQPPVCCVWAYDRCHPVAEVRNAAWTEVEPFVGGLATYPDADGLQSLFGRMRAAMPAALVSGYVYRMLVGIAATFDPSGRAAYYEYDDGNRLSVVRDEDGNPRRRFEYQVKHKE